MVVVAVAGMLGGGGGGGGNNIDKMQRQLDAAKRIADQAAKTAADQQAEINKLRAAAGGGGGGGAKGAADPPDDTVDSKTLLKAITELEDELKDAEAAHKKRPTNPIHIAERDRVKALLEQKRVERREGRDPATRVEAINKQISAKDKKRKAADDRLCEINLEQRNLEDEDEELTEQHAKLVSEIEALRIEAACCLTSLTGKDLASPAEQLGVGMLPTALVATVEAALDRTCNDSFAHPEVLQRAQQLVPLFQQFKTFGVLLEEFMVLANNNTSGRRAEAVAEQERQASAAEARDRANAAETRRLREIATEGAAAARESATNAPPAVTPATQAAAATEVQASLEALEALQERLLQAQRDQDTQSSAGNIGNVTTMQTLIEAMQQQVQVAQLQHQQLLQQHRQHGQLPGATATPASPPTTAPSAIPVPDDLDAEMDHDVGTPQTEEQLQQHRSGNGGTPAGNLPGGSFAAVVARPPAAQSQPGVPAPATPAGLGVPAPSTPTAAPTPTAPVAPEPAKRPTNKLRTLDVIQAEKAAKKADSGK